MKQSVFVCALTWMFGCGIVGAAERCASAPAGDRRTDAPLFRGDLPALIQADWIDHDKQFADALPESTGCGLEREFSLAHIRRVLERGRQLADRLSAVANAGHGLYGRQQEGSTDDCRSSAFRRAIYSLSI